MKAIKTLLIATALMISGTAFAGSWGFSLGNGAGFYFGNGGGNCWGGGYGYGGGGYVVPMQPYQTFYYSQPTYYYPTPPVYYNYGPNFYWGNNGGGCWNGNRNNGGRNKN